MFINKTVSLTFVVCFSVFTGYFLENGNFETSCGKFYFRMLAIVLIALYVKPRGYEYKNIK